MRGKYGKPKNLNLKKPYIVILVIMAVLAISSFFVVNKNVYNPARERGLHQVEPVSHEVEEDGSDVYTFEFIRLRADAQMYVNKKELKVKSDGIRRIL